MFRQTVTWCSCVLLSSVLTSTAAGQTYEKLLDFIDDIRVGTQYDLIGAHCFEGNTAYCIVRGIESQITPEWESQITKVVDIDGTPSTTELVSYAQWKAFTGADPADTILPGNRMAVLDGDYLQFADHVTDAVYRVHKTTGTIYLFVANSAIRAHTGLGQARLIDAVAISTNGAMAFYDEDSDSLLLAEVNDNGDLTTNGKLTTLVTDAEFEDFYGTYPVNNVAGGMTFDAEDNLYWTLSYHADAGAASGAIYRRRASDGKLQLLFSQAEIQKATGSGQNVAFNDIYAAPDGLVYFYDRADDVDSIVHFDPVNSNGPTVFLTEAQVQSGPAGAGEVNISALNSFGTKLTWHHVDRWYDLYAKTLAGRPGDFDNDGDYDLWDAGAFQRCFDVLVGSNGCVEVDYNTNGVIDLDDWVEFEAGLAGPK